MRCCRDAGCMFFLRLSSVAYLARLKVRQIKRALRKLPWRPHRLCRSRNLRGSSMSLVHICCVRGLPLIIWLGRGVLRRPVWGPFQILPFIFETLRAVGVLEKQRVQVQRWEKKRKREGVFRTLNALEVGILYACTDPSPPAPSFYLFRVSPMMPGSFPLGECVLVLHRRPWRGPVGRRMRHPKKICPEQRKRGELLKLLEKYSNCYKLYFFFASFPFFKNNINSYKNAFSFVASSQI